MPIWLAYANEAILPVVEACLGVISRVLLVVMIVLVCRGAMAIGESVFWMVVTK